MDNNVLVQLLPKIIKLKGQANVTVFGISMEPSLFEGDIVTIQKCDKYSIGDILVFNYKNEGVLIHRLLRYNNRYFCKGDNSFRLEDVDLNEIIGKAVLVNGTPIPDWPEWKINLSYLVNRTFVKNRYDKTETKKTSIYKLYKALILRKEDTIMNYKKTEKMDFIITDETSLAVFDSESGDTYFFDETGLDILNCIDEPCSLESILKKLCGIYDVSAEAIKNDVEEFLADTITKGIVEVV